MQNKTTLIGTCHNFSRKMWLCANDIKPKHIICHQKVFLVTGTNSRSLPQSKIMFGSDLITKPRLHGTTCQRSGYFRQKLRASCWGGAMLNTMAPRIAIKTGWRWPFQLWEVEAFLYACLLESTLAPQRPTSWVSLFWHLLITVVWRVRPHSS